MNMDATLPLGRIGRRLAEDEKRTWERKALFFNYAAAAGDA